MLGPAEVNALCQLREGRTLEESHTRHSEQAGAGAIDEARLAQVLADAARVGFVRPARILASRRHSSRAQIEQAVAATARLRNKLTEWHSAHDAEVLAQRRNGSTDDMSRLAICPIVQDGQLPPLSLGMVLAFARQEHEQSLSDVVDFYPRWTLESAVSEMVDERTALYLFSDYVWSHDRNLAISRFVKDRSPTSLVIHGGPDAPTHQADAETYFARHPYVDIIVRGEGEHSFAELLDVLGQQWRSNRGFDLAALAAVAGLIVRVDSDAIVRTPDRERIADLDSIPSPFLTGLYDGHTEAGVSGYAIIETNRGCPYGCTYCDWGSATRSRIRKFDLDRVLDEIEWAGKSQVDGIFLADANFGIFARDVEIARKVAETKNRYGYPKVFSTNYAKNTVKHLKQIVQIVAAADVTTEGLLSLQTMDQPTLDTVRRSNIKTTKYDDLAREFRSAGLPLFVDLMMALPGSTLDSFRSDLQQCVDREVSAKVFNTAMLVNSPMNERSYRHEHQIVTLTDPIPGRDASDRQAFVVSSASFTREDFIEMTALRRAFRLFETFGVLRHLSRYVRHATGLDETRLFEQIVERTRAEPGRWPALYWTAVACIDVGMPPGSWAALIDDVRRFAIDECSVPDDSALATVLAVQHAHLPAPGRSFPQRLDLDHDFETWHRTMVDAKDRGHLRNWPDLVPPLGSLGPSSLEVCDPRALEFSLGPGASSGGFSHWEFDSPVARPMPLNLLAETG